MGNEMAMKNILVAGPPESHDFANQAYGDLAAVTFARGVNDAKFRLETCPPDILIGTLAFDDSRFLELMSLARARHVKVVVVDCPYTILDDIALDAIRATASDLGIAAWWNMRKILAAEGPDAAVQEIRAIVTKLLDDSGPPALEP